MTELQGLKSFKLKQFIASLKKTIKVLRNRFRMLTNPIHTFRCDRDYNESKVVYQSLSGK